jgi:hypothetical protein
VQDLIPHPAAVVRWQSVLEGTPGRCANLDYCSIGMQRLRVTIPLGEPFICPECGKPLRPPAEANAGRPWVMPALRILVLVIGIGLGGVQGYLIGRVQPAVHGAVSAASKDAALQLNTARAMLGLKTLAPDAIVAVPAATSPSPPSPPPPAPAAAVLVQQRPYPARTVPLDLADPAQHLQREERAGQVTMDCILVAARGKPSCRVGDIRGSDAFSAASLAWLSKLAVKYAGDGRDGRLGGPDHRWRIIFEDFRGAAPAARTQAAPKP